MRPSSTIRERAGEKGDRVSYLVPVPHQTILFCATRVPQCLRARVQSVPRCPRVSPDVPSNAPAQNEPTDAFECLPAPSSLQIRPSSFSVVIPDSARKNNPDTTNPTRMNHPGRSGLGSRIRFTASTWKQLNPSAAL